MKEKQCSSRVESSRIESNVAALPPLPRYYNTMKHGLDRTKLYLDLFGIVYG